MRKYAPECLFEAYKSLTFVGKGYVCGKLYYLGIYPGIILDGEGKVFGEVFRITDESCLPWFDYYEGFYPNDQGSLFVRRVSKVYITSGEVVKSWVYEYNGSVEKAEFIESGDFEKYLNFKEICFQ